jgi:hypothetical protein
MAPNIPTSDNRAISSINLLKNRIPVEQAQELVKIMQRKEKLVTLCGLSKEEVELDFSGQDLHAGDAVLIANDISDMGALTSLDVSNNNLGLLATENGWTSKDGDNLAPWVHPDGRKQKEKPEGLKPLGVIAIANAIPDMRALIKLDISRNCIGAAQEEELQRLCLASGITLDK